MVFLLMAGCTFDTSGIPANGGDTGGESGSDGPAGCTPGCTGDTRQVCEPERALIPCPLGCAPELDTCRALVPSNGATAAHLQDATTTLVVPAGASGVIDTDTGAIDVDGHSVRSGLVNDIDGGIGFYRLADTGVSVVALAGLTVERNARLLARGSRPLVLLSAGDISIEGVIDVSAGCTDGGSVNCGGPGGANGSTDDRVPAEGCAPGGNGTGESNSDVDETGGGGGGLGTDGARGGNGRAVTAGGAGGAVSGSDCPGPELVPLRGGSGGGAGGVGRAGGVGGGGGGAVQITSLTRIAISGRLDEPTVGIVAAGSGGAGGSASGGGGGGGAGGAILLEAPAIELSGAVLAANGGGGGGGAIGNTPGPQGSNGTFDSRQALGGSATGSKRGGSGASLQGGATSGLGAGDDTGGGGGGAGIIRLNVPEAGLTRASTVISPEPTRGDPAVE